MKLLDKLPDNHIVHSPSSLKLFSSCPRAWYYNYAEGIKRPQTRAMSLGSSMHEALENWLKSGEYPDTSTKQGMLAAAIIPLLPAPSGGLVEQHMILQLDNGSFVHGYADYVTETTVYDHKTTSNWKYALTEETLQEDLQALIYSAAVYSVTGELPILQWNYVITRGKPLGRAVSTVIENFDEKMQALMELCERIEGAVEYPQNFASCSNYGGCYYRDRCSNGTFNTIF